MGERTHAHLYETGGMRRLHLRGRENILKRLLIQAAALNLALLLRRTLGVGTPRALQGLLRGLLDVWRRVLHAPPAPQHAPGRFGPQSGSFDCLTIPRRLLPLAA